MAAPLVPLLVLLLVLGASGSILHRILLLPWLRRRHYERQGLRGPAFHPIVGNHKERTAAMERSASMNPVPLHQLTSEIVLPELHSLSQQHGKVFVHEILWTTTLVLCDPALVREVLVTKVQHYTKAPIIRTLVRSVLGKGLVFADGDFWRSQRRIHNPAFQKTFLRGMFEHIKDCSNELAQRWRERIAESGGTAEVEVNLEMSTSTLDIIARCAFGANIPGSAPTSKGVLAFQSITPLFIGNIMKLFKIAPLLPGYRFLPTPENIRNWQRERYINKLMEEILVARLKAVESVGLRTATAGHPYGNDLLGMMIDAWKGGSPTMTRQQLLDECKTIFVAGHSTTALGITWALFLLAAHPEWQHRLRKEVQDVGMHVDNFGKLKQMDMFMKEVYRLYSPVANIFRECQQPHKIGDKLDILPGTLVVIPILLMHQIRDYWGDDFDQFNPKRWENRPAHSDEYIPFGAGQRHCLGKEFAWMETVSMLGTILSQFEFSLSPAYRHAPGQVQSIRPLYGMQLLVRELEK